MDPNESSIDSRLMMLERQYRRLQGVLAVVGLLACAGIIAHYLPGPSTLGARRFVVVDAAQTVRAELVAADDGDVLLRLNNAAGKARTILRLEREGNATLRLSDAQGFNRLELGIDQDGEPSLALTGPDGRTRTRLGLYEPDHQPGLSLLDPSRKISWSAP
jgi:hypothetical protein